MEIKRLGVTAMGGNPVDVALSDAYRLRVSNTLSNPTA